MLELLIIIIGVTLGTLLAIALLVVLTITRPRFAREYLRSLVIIGKELMEDIIDCL